MGKINSQNISRRKFIGILSFTVGFAFIAANGLFIKNSKSIKTQIGKNKIIFKNEWLYDFYFKEFDSLTIENFLEQDNFYLINGVLVNAEDIEINGV